MINSNNMVVEISNYGNPILKSYFKLNKYDDGEKIMLFVISFDFESTPLCYEFFMQHVFLNNDSVGQS